VTKRILRWVGGLALGLLVWVGLGPVYHPLVDFVVARTFNIVEHPNITSLEQNGNDVLVNRADFDRRSPKPQLSVSDLTFNIVLVIALAVGAGMDKRKRELRISAAIAIMLLVHAGALYAKIMSIYALNLGPWSEANYGPFARNLWGISTHFYRFVGIHASAFLVWWYVLGGASVVRQARD